MRQLSAGKWQASCWLTTADGYKKRVRINRASESDAVEALKTRAKSIANSDHEAPPADPTWLYRMFNRDGDLLYIGISNDPVLRLSQHANEKPWVKREVTKWEIEPTSYPSFAAALAAERKAIEAEHPRYNVVHNQRKTA